MFWMYAEYPDTLFELFIRSRTHRQRTRVVARRMRRRPDIAVGSTHGDARRVTNRTADRFVVANQPGRIAATADATTVFDATGASLASAL
jgi:hypothetical protein